MSRAIPALAWTVFFSAIPAAMLFLPDVATALAAFAACKLTGVALWMACHTQEEIAAAEDIERSTLANMAVEFVHATSDPAAQALLAGLMQGIGEREKDEVLLSAGRKLAEAAERETRIEVPASSL